MLVAGVLLLAANGQTKDLKKQMLAIANRTNKAVFGRESKDKDWKRGVGAQVLINGALKLDFEKGTAVLWHIHFLDPSPIPNPSWWQGLKTERLAEKDAYGMQLLQRVWPKLDGVMTQCIGNFHRQRHLGFLWMCWFVREKEGRSQFLDIAYETKSGKPIDMGLSKVGKYDQPAHILLDSRAKRARK